MAPATANRKDGNLSLFDKAPDELMSHILQCRVADAAEEHQRDWFDDTLQYLGERYVNLSRDQLAALRGIGEQFCQPVKPHGAEVA